MALASRQKQELFPANRLSPRSALSFFSLPLIPVSPNEPRKLHLLLKILMNQSWLRVICLLHCIIA